MPRSSFRPVSALALSLAAACSPSVRSPPGDAGAEAGARDMTRPEVTLDRAVPVADAASTPQAADKADTGSGSAVSDGAARATDAATPSARDACSDYVASVCGKWDACSPFYLETWFKDAAACALRMRPLCEAQLTAAGTAETPRDRLQCAQALAALSCDRWLALETPAACQPKPGTVAGGSGCVSNWQCQSTYCALDAGCGVCVVRAGVSGSCTEDTGCDAGLVCNALGRCAAPAALGKSCSVEHPCHPGGHCAQGICVRALGAGASCSGGDCSELQGLYCSDLGAVCRAYGVAGAGEPCGWVSNDAWTTCAGDSYCRFPGSMTALGVCAERARDGQLCDDESGPLCIVPAMCVGGRCRLPSSCN